MKIVFRLITLAIIAITCAETAYAEKKDFKRAACIRDVKANIKGETYAKAIEIIDNAMKTYPEDAGNDPELYSLRIESLRNLMLDEARKMYLKQNADTAKYFGFIYEMYVNGIQCDSLANIPNSKGKVNNPYHKTILADNSKNLKNLFAGCNYSYKKNDYAKAYNYASMYLRMGGEHRTNAASIAVLSAFAQQKYDSINQYMETALNDSSISTQLYEIQARANAKTNNRKVQKEALTKGWEGNPTHDFFYLNLLNLYHEDKDYQSALELTQKQLEFDNHNRDLWYIKGNEELSLERYDEALTSFNSAVNIKADDALSFSAIGNILLKKAQSLYDALPSVPKDLLLSKKMELRTLQTKAKDAFESARKFNSTETTLWLSGLRELYFKLNMGKELKQLESANK